MTDSNLQPNRTEQKFPFPSVTLCRLHSVPFRSAEKARYRELMRYSGCHTEQRHKWFQLARFIDYYRPNYKQNRTKSGSTFAEVMRRAKSKSKKATPYGAARRSMTSHRAAPPVNLDDIDGLSSCCVLEDKNSCWP
uniref:Uncharacterized protein n=1 Tax=Romanomermis culicivorax TaxID=13658 RepID=A0A915J9C9_ROMCU